MSLRKRAKMLDFAVGALLRRKGRNGAILVVFTFVVALLFSILFLVESLKAEAQLLLSHGPDLVVQRVQGGRHELIPAQYAESIGALRGVRSVQPRVWGYYYDAYTEANFTVMESRTGPEEFALVSGRMPQAKGELAIGKGVARLRQLGEWDEFILIDGSGLGVTFQVVGVFETDSHLLTNDLVVMTPDDIRAFFLVEPGRATDVMVTVANPNEVNTVARKIRRIHPDSRPISRKEVLRTYDAVFNWRSGMLLAAFAGAVIAFCVLAWDKATGLSGEERREIGVLKAVGWDTSDVLEVKFWEGAAISLTALLAGLVVAYVHVFFLDATLLVPVLRGWSVLFPTLEVVPRPDLYSVVRVGFFTVIPYVASTVLPSWRAAVADPDAVIRG